MVVLLQLLHQQLLGGWQGRPCGVWWVGAQPCCCWLLLWGCGCG